MSHVHNSRDGRRGEASDEQALKSVATCRESGQQKRRGFHYKSSLAFLSNYALRSTSLATFVNVFQSNCNSLRNDMHSFTNSLTHSPTHSPCRCAVDGIGAENSCLLLRATTSLCAPLNFSKVEDCLSLWELLPF